MFQELTRFKAFIEDMRVLDHAVRNKKIVQNYKSMKVCWKFLTFEVDGYQAYGGQLSVTHFLQNEDLMLR
jgi:hypothetical protein